MKYFPILILLFLSITFSGCATPQIKVTYHSDPPGASLYSGNRPMGYCPTILAYNISPQDRRRGYVLLQSAEVKWVSGATAKIDQLKAFLATGTYQQFTFMRPNGVAGMEADAKFGLEVQKVRLMKQQVQAQKNANLWQMYNAISKQQQSSSSVKLKANCRSRVSGGIVYTDCY